MPARASFVITSEACSIILLILLNPNGFNYKKALNIDALMLNDSSVGALLFSRRRCALTRQGLYWVLSPWKWLGELNCPLLQAGKWISLDFLDVVLGWSDVFQVRTRKQNWVYCTPKSADKLFVLHEICRQFSLLLDMSSRYMWYQP